MKINGRLLLILCAVVLFTRIWSANGHRSDRSALPRNAVTANSRALATTKSGSRPVLRQTAELRAPSKGRETTPVGSDEIWTVQTVPFKLPEGLAPGHYRVVSDAGRVGRLTIDPIARTAGAAPEFVAITTETERWYLIRLKSDLSGGRPSFSTAWNNRLPSVPDLTLSLDFPSANRKFDFTGCVPEAAIDATPTAEPPIENSLPASSGEALLQQAERPAPPELPSPL